MVRVDLSGINTIEEFNTKIREKQTEAHGKHYCDIHDAISRYLTPGDSYMELGVNQGGTASMALLCDISKVILVDIDTTRYFQYLHPLAERHCKKHNIELRIITGSSIDLTISNNVDVLVIDSLHESNHMMKELELHGKNVRKYIIAHDTSIINGRLDESLFNCLTEYANINGWSVVERGITSVGYTVLKRTAEK